MALEKVANLSDVQPGQLLLVEVEGRGVCIANVDGELFAFDNACPHRSGPLNEGSLDVENVECPLHGSKFNVRSGEVVQGPAREPLTIVNVTTDGDAVLVEG